MKTVLRLILVLLYVFVVRTYQIPNWQSLQEKLHEKIDEIFKREKHIAIQAGKFFKYVVPGDIGNYEAFEFGTNQLPSWLTFDQKKNKLQGVPVAAELKNSLKIEFRKKNENSINGFADGSSYLILDSKFHSEPFNCKSDATTVGSVIFHTDIKNFDATHRVTFLRNFAAYMDIPIRDLHLAEGNRMETEDFDSLSANIRKAGPGDRKIKGELPGITVSWKVTCGINIAGDPKLSKLTLLSQEEDFVSVFKEPVLGWLVTSTNQNRARRETGTAGTPVVGATPSLSIGGGTPTSGPSPSVSVFATAKVKPTISPSPSVVMKMTSMPPTQPPVVTTTTKKTTASTTEKPTTQEATTKEITVEVITDESTTEMVPTVPVNRAPVLQKDGFGMIEVISGQALKIEVPHDLFFDADSDALSITLKYYPNRGDDAYPVPANHWISYSDKNMYMLPHKSLNGGHRFALTATDPSGAMVNDVFTVEIRNDPNIFYNIIYNVTLDLDFTEYNSSVKKRVMLVEDLTRALNGESNVYDVSQLRGLNFLPGSVIIQWSVDAKVLSSCNDVEVQRYVQVLESAEFKNAMATSSYIVTDVGMIELKECTVPVPEGIDDDDDGLLTRILIPVIVIVIILLIIALILCCVYQRKRKYDPQSEQDNDYFNRKKPVIFLEEYEEKQDFVSLQPLILPNEKPPVQAYEPRADTPDGPSSSTTGSTENEEKELLPSSPKDSPRKAFNAPPPYSAH